MKTLAEKKKDQEEQDAKDDAIWDIWQDESIVSWKPRRMPKPITAPKRDLPDHAESFNPAEEYLFDDKEKQEWEEAEEEDRQLNYMP
jgi:ribosome biogenesis protein ERB1